MSSGINFAAKPPERVIPRKGQQKLSEQEIALAMRTITASWSFEGFDSTKENDAINYKILKGEMTDDEAVDYYLAKRGLKRYA